MAVSIVSLTTVEIEFLDSLASEGKLQTLQGCLQGYRLRHDWTGMDRARIIERCERWILALSAKHPAVVS